MLILPPNRHCCCQSLPQPLHLPFRPSSTRNTTARTPSWLGFAARNIRVSPLLSSGVPQLSPHDATGSAENFQVELGRMLALLPEEMRRRVSEHPELQDLIEVVMDFGRKPLARFPSGDFVLSDHPITMEDILHATSQVGDFAVDNRAGISRTLHRISAIRNRKGAIIGLTCRVGRAVSGSANLLRDLVKDGASLLLIGPPGVGKTTIIRDIARMLANEYMMRVMIVDTSNEIGGEGDIPHSGIGDARRMQVPHTDVQHKVVALRFASHQFPSPSQKALPPRPNLGEQTCTSSTLQIFEITTTNLLTSPFALKVGIHKKTNVIIEPPNVNWTTPNNTIFSSDAIATTAPLDRGSKALFSKGSP